MINWARIARNLFVDTWGRVLPTDIENMTIDQVAILWIDDAGLGKGGTRLMSPAEASAKGITEGGKSAVQLEVERQKREQENSVRDVKRRKRQRRQQAEQGGHNG